VERDPISLRQAFKLAWPILKERFGLFAAVLLTIFGAWVALEVVVVAGQRFGILLWAVAHAAFLIFAAGIEVGLLAMGLALHDGRAPTFRDAFAHLALGPRFLAAQILYLLMVVIGLAVLVAPGICLGVRYTLFGFCMADGEANLIRSFQKSAVLSTGAEAYLLRMLLVLVALNLLGASVLGIGLFVTLPLSVLVLATVYQRLSTRHPTHPV
jgi:hypothetical protein